MRLLLSFLGPKDSFRRANNTLVGTLMGGTYMASVLCWSQSPVLVAVLQVPRVKWVKHFPLE